MRKNIKMKYIAIAVLLLLLLLFTPSIIDLLFLLGDALPFAILTSFDKEALLSYIGGAVLPIVATIILGFIVYKQAERLDAIDTKIATDSFAYTTFTFLVVDEIKILETPYHVRTPEDAPNKILTFDLLEGIVLCDLAKMKHGFTYIEGWGNTEVIIDLSAGSTGRNLIMYPTVGALDGKYLFCTPMEIKFFATPSKEFYIRKMELTKFGFALMKNGRTPYGFSADIRVPIDVMVSQDTDGDSDVCKYTFSVTAHLLHDILDLRAN
ncbi:MAG: hypothetical protein FWB97_00450 [Oscillospiraceae bacterium]|nr:hypothetical protein [Oscillospiraceae bacterium]